MKSTLKIVPQRGVVRVFAIAEVICAVSRPSMVVGEDHPFVFLQVDFNGIGARELECFGKATPRFKIISKVC